MRAGRCHLVLNSLSADLTAVSFALLGEECSFMEIGKRAVWSHQRVNSACEARIQLGVLAIDDELSAKPEWMQGHLATLARRVVSGVLHPLPLAIFDAWRSYEEAFRLLQSGSNVGKVVLRIAPVPSTSSSLISPHATQLLTGGTGGLGVLTAKWLAKHGSSSILLASRSGLVHHSIAVPSAARAVRCDAAEHHDCRRLLLKEQRIGGLWHAAGVLSDGLIAKQAASMLQRVFAPKVHGAWALQDASSGHPLDACVLFSSIAALYMSVAQANYAAANECLDALAEHRVARAQHAVSVQWGPWAGFG
jgi:hypothetical protein